MSSLNDGKALPLMEHFYTIQGEGAYSGHAAYFIRLGGCDVGCVWCDVKDSWDASNHPLVNIEEMLQFVLQTPAKLCVITGGEPAMYNLDPLTQLLKINGIRVHIETSGAYPINGNFDWICISPKKFKLPIQEALVLCDEYKQVVYHPSDINWTQQFLDFLKPSCLLMLQPEWSKAESMSTLIIDYVKANPQWSISLQTHKFLNIP
jgi:organic radical activating enzyme